MTASAHPGCPHCGSSVYLSYDVLRRWPRFAAVEQQLRIGMRVEITVDRFGIGGDFTIAEFAEHGIRFEAGPAVPSPQNQTETR